MFQIVVIASGLFAIFLNKTCIIIKDSDRECAFFVEKLCYNCCFSCETRMFKRYLLKFLLLTPTRCF